MSLGFGGCIEWYILAGMKVSGNDLLSNVNWKVITTHSIPIKNLVMEYIAWPESSAIFFCWYFFLGRRYLQIALGFISLTNKNKAASNFGNQSETDYAMSIIVTIIIS